MKQNWLENEHFNIQQGYLELVVWDPHKRALFCQRDVFFGECAAVLYGHVLKSHNPLSSHSQFSFTFSSLFFALFSKSAPWLESHSVSAVLTLSSYWPSLFLSPVVLLAEHPQPDVVFSQSLSPSGFKTQVLRMIKKSPELRGDFKRKGWGTSGKG